MYSSKGFREYFCIYILFLVLDVGEFFWVFWDVWVKKDDDEVVDVDDDDDDIMVIETGNPWWHFFKRIKYISNCFWHSQFKKTHTFKIVVGFRLVNLGLQS